MLGKKKPSLVATAAVDLGGADLFLELRQGEVGSANVEYLISLKKDLDTLNGHPLFVGMVNEEPRKITNSVEDTGFQSVFDAQLYQKAIASGTYTAGGNLFWVDFRWSANTGVPLRLQAVHKLASTLFATPTPYPGAMHIAVTRACVPLNHRGAWYSVSPEELAHAKIFAVADAVRTEAANTDLLN